MKYFTFALWKALQGDESAKAERQWLNNIRRYRNQFEALKDQLGQTSYRFFATEGLHDSLVKSIEIGKKNSVSMLIQKQKTQYHLKFDGIYYWSLRYNQGYDSLSFGSILEWGYEEFSLQDGERLQLEILFSSGTACRIGFKTMRIRSNRSPDRTQRA